MANTGERGYIVPLNRHRTIGIHDSFSSKVIHSFTFLTIVQLIKCKDSEEKISFIT